MEGKGTGKGKGAREFIKQIDRDPALQGKLKKAQADFVAVGRQHGFEFTQAELHDELRKRWEITKPADDPDTCTVTVP